MTLSRQENWGLGSNNVAGRAHMPATKDGRRSIREGVNVDIMTGGEFRGRIGYEKVTEATNARGLMKYKNSLFFADGTALKRFDTRFNSTSTEATIANSGVVCGTEHAGELFINSRNARHRYDGAEFRSWGVDTVIIQPSYTLSDGGMRAGTYKLAATFVNSHGEEGGTLTARNVVITSDSRIQVSNIPTAPAGGFVRIYLSTCDGSTMYLQAETTAASIAIDSAKADGMQLETQFQRPPPYGEIMESNNGVILIADEKILWVTVPMRPHLCDMARGFYQFQSLITNVLSVPAGVFITTEDKTYMLLSPETTEVSLREVLDIGAVKFSGVSMPDAVAWMTEYGQAIGSHSGEVTFPNKGAYAPLLFDKAAAGIVRHNGNEMIVTAIRGYPEQSALAASDYYDSEVIITGKQTDQASLADTFVAEVIAP